MTDSVGGLASVITIDAAAARPLVDKPAICIQPPEARFLTWTETELIWKIVVIAGTNATQAAAMDEIFRIIDKLQSDLINLKTALPITWQIPNAGTAAAYEIELNPLE